MAGRTSSLLHLHLWSLLEQTISKDWQKCTLTWERTSQGKSTIDSTALQIPLRSCSELALLHSPRYPDQKRCMNNILCRQCWAEKGKAAPYPYSHPKPLGSRNWQFSRLFKDLYPKVNQSIWIDVTLAAQSWKAWDLPAGTHSTHTCNKPGNFWGKLNLFPLA